MSGLDIGEFDKFFQSKTKSSLMILIFYVIFLSDQSLPGDALRNKYIFIKAL